MHSCYIFLYMPNWDDFRYFLAAAQSGSLSAAAELLDSNQPTVGRHIEALEQELGIRLFRRHHRGIDLTEEGAEVLKQAQLMESGVINIQRMLSEHSGQYRGTVRLSVPEGVCNELILPALPGFRKSQPGIQIILSPSARLSNLVLGEADIALRLKRPAESDLVTRHLLTMNMGLFASKSYLKNHKAIRKQDCLKNHHFIVYGEALSHLDENRWLTDVIKDSNIALYSDSTSARLRATEEGIGISIQPLIIAAPNPKLVQLLPRLTLPSHELWIAYHKDLRHFPRIRCVVDFLTGLFSG